MRVQLTNYGVSKINELQAPLEITKYVLGSESAYTPEMDATGVKGEEVYTSAPTSMTIVNANVYKYQIGLDYAVGNFNFGEVALYDSSNKCVAVGVAEEIISKIKTSGSSGGNSVVLGIYLSMVSKNYAMWIDTLASDNQYAVPILESVDSLPSTSNSYPNFYSIKSVSPSMSGVLAYASKDGLWYFDAYAFANQIALTVKEATATSIKFSTEGLTNDQIASALSIQYYGDKIVEFTSGEAYSICRNVKSASVLGKNAVFSFNTPLANVPVPGDTFLIFSRSSVSTNVVDIPTATKDTLGVIKPGEDLVVSADGTLSIDLTKERILETLAPFNESGELLQLSAQGDEQIAGADGNDFSGARVKARQLTYGALYFAGVWDAVDNVVNHIAGQSVKPNGLFSVKVSEDKYKEWKPLGWIFRVEHAGTVAIDELTECNAGDLIVCTDAGWTYLNDKTEFVKMPTTDGFVVIKNGKSVAYMMKPAADGGLVMTESDDGMTFGLAESGVEAGVYGSCVEVDKFGRVTSISGVISAGTF